MQTKLINESKLGGELLFSLPILQIFMFFFAEIAIIPHCHPEILDPLLQC